MTALSKTSFISLRSISLSYNNNQKILDKFNLDIEQGSFITIIGSSGSGKTSILNLIAGFTKPDAGKILLNGIDIKDIPAQDRPTATVFQDYSLFTHMNVYDNISYGLNKMYADCEKVSEKSFKKVNELINKANLFSKLKLKKLNEEILKFFELIKYYSEKWNLHNEKTRFLSLKSFYINSLKKKIIDLDYWKSYWEYYPILTEKKLKEKYLKRPLNKDEIKEKVTQIINLLGLQGKEFADINTLSGGTKQKVALARSLVIEPTILLLDEPLGAIDKKVREKMQLELKRLHKKLKITFVLITHDQQEALILSDKIVVLKMGQIEQIGTPSEIYDSPINPWVANFMGKANLFYGIYLEPGKIKVKDKIFNSDVISGFESNEDVVVMIRPEDYDVVDFQKGIIDVKVLEAVYKGQLWELKCDFYGETIYVENIDEVKIGQRIGLVWDMIDVHVMKHSEI